ncbi:molybdate transport system substrate-binding protein [Lipingzhangella halophila]|uniref:Molybdate transport system substrate-binding protein n=1 Tax=Lipingzhangella halophila TaxID=1783352 RepID=A0A7W7W031_9ACTN|nr:molybdate ABC transporter substrate-binding protein [Lipingzhangella halophila]MBB4929487.1 molybdate transport system substrate-binding protein [Lipingzhangella halophila]
MPDHFPKTALLAGLTAASVLASGCGSEAAGSEGEVRVAVASNLKFAMADIVAEFEDAHPGTTVAASYGSSGAFVQQISNGAPFDVFLSADTGYPEDLVQDGLADTGDVFGYAAGRLVVWAAADSPADPSGGLPALADDAVGTVAIANPEHAPYGTAAQAALESAGVADDIEDKLVLGENIAQTAEFAQSGNADAAVVALSLALSPSMSASGEHSEVPPGSYPRLDQSGVVLPDSANPGGARDLAGFLRSEDGQAILEEHGFAPPEPGEEG